MKKKKIIIILSIIISIVIIGILVFINFKKLKVNIENNVQIALNDKKYNTDYLKELKNGTVINNEELIDTSKIGTQKVKIIIKNFWGQKKDYFFQVNIYDDEKPQIRFNKNLETEVGSEIDLLKDVTVKDNSNENIEVNIEGEYDFNKAGSYTLYYVAKDSSNNETKEEFTLTVTEKKNTTSNQNTSANNINNETTFTTSKGFNGVVKNGVTYIDGYLIVNKTYSLPSNYGSALTSQTTEAFAQMQAAALLEGIDLYISSGFRSYQRQNTLYNNYVARDGVNKADTFSARPGHSEHQSGLAFDVCSHNLDGKNACINSNFDNTPQAQWLAQNCYKYGFILRYPEGKTNETGYKYESWHFRYVGIDLATKLYNNGNWLTMEDYFGITSTY